MTGERPKSAEPATDAAGGLDEPECERPVQHPRDRRGSLGATVVAADAGGLIGEISLVMTNGIRLGGIARAIHPYPTQAEALRKVGDVYNRIRLKPWIARAMSTWLRLRR